MEPSSSSIKVGLINKIAIIKISGRANFSTSLDFKKLITKLTSNGTTHFIIELSDCQMMDSTFLGVLAGVGLKFSGADHDGVPIALIELLNPNGRISDLLESLGVGDLFRVRTSKETPPTTELNAIQNCEKDKMELTKNCLEAHQLLMQLNPENIQRFKDVTQFFAEDLKRLEEGKEQ
jgi:anti-anti-sigma factor